MNLINLKIATAVTAVLTMVTSLAPEAAHAQRAASGRSLNVTSVFVNFTLNTSEPDSSQNINIGQYTTGIQNFSAYLSQTNNDSLVDVSVSAPSVTLYAFRVPRSQLLPTSGNSVIPIPTPLTGFTTNLNDLINPNTNSISSGINTQGYQDGLVVYEAAFDAVNNKGDLTSNKLALFVPSLGNQSLDSQSLVNSLSGLNNIDFLQGKFSSTDVNNANNSFRRDFGIGGEGPISLQAVPEPSDTAGVLAFGAMGAISLLRRNKHHSIHLSNRNATLSKSSGKAPTIVARR